MKAKAREKEKVKEIENEKKVREKEIGIGNEIEDGALVEEQGLGMVTSPLPAATLAPLSPTPRAEGSGEEVLPLSASHPPIGASAPQGHDDHGQEVHVDPLRGEGLTDALNSLTVAEARFTTPNPPACHKGTGNRSPYMFRPLKSRCSDDHESEGDTNPSAEMTPSLPSALSFSSPTIEPPVHV